MATSKSAANQTPAAGNPEKDEAPRTTQRPLGEYVMDHKEIPKEISAFVTDKLGKDASVHPAREGGGYKGKVLLNNDQYLVQGVGREGKSAVLHRKEDIEIKGSNLVWRDENKRLGSVDVQIHYDAGKAKMYAWNREREDQMRFVTKAQEFAKTITSAKERGVFLKHLTTFAGQDRGAPEKPAPRAEKAQEKTTSRTPKKGDQGRAELER
ncbi:hypothetical protein K6X12_06535 [Xanthomonas euvesicatoria pv. allii]|uniref:KfrB domain-containing protein n=1 Tax=Xanthomonas euvesicatoria TaxID=456327 RepID=UPI002405E51F|nr:hypothetical protein [Xanthomonas euvesicatoria]MCP3050754.1 hypothetical protein [Xanthomonas euvesicatoria pv. allii]